MSIVGSDVKGLAATVNDDSIAFKGCNYVTANYEAR